MSRPAPIRHVWRRFDRLPSALAVAACLVAGPALAQAPAAPQLPVQPPPAAAPAPGPRATLSLAAVFAGDARQIRSGLAWRIFRDNDSGSPVIVARSNDPNPVFQVEPGTYIIHASYGFATSMRRVAVRANMQLSERMTISAGALRLSGAIGDQPIAAGRLSFNVYVPIGSDSEGRLVVSNGKAGDLIRLPEGTYHVVSTYGDTNSIMRSDLQVESGRVTEATLNHRAATLTLKLVTAPGGEALAGVAFSVLTPGGDVIREAIGAFPQLVLADGDYVVIARHDGQVYTREFKVDSGVDRDIEVLAR